MSWNWDYSAYEGAPWSNSNSRYHMAQFIDTATERLDVQHPKYVDAVMLERLAAAPDRAVKVHVLGGGKHGISEWDILDVDVHKQKNLRVHAKVDRRRQRSRIGRSMNIDRSAFDLRRELGTMTNDPAIVGRLKEVFDSDWDLSHHYEATTRRLRGDYEATTRRRIRSIRPSTHDDDFPHDEDVMHE